MLMWVGFFAFVLILLAFDLGVLNRKAHVPSVKEAVVFTGLTALLAIAFAGFIYAAYDHHWATFGSAADMVDHRINDGRLAMVKFLTGYIVEISLSMDNVFVIALIFEHMQTPRAMQHRVLFWGILGALVMRGAMIAGGAALVARFEWILYLFGAFLLITALRMLSVQEKEEAPEESFVVRWLHKHFRVTRKFQGKRFLVHEDGKTFITPLMVTLVLVETTDLIFAVDSIPAIFAITTDAFLVFTSNVFAILCLRSLYFALAGLIERFRYLRASLAVILGIVGAKMISAKWTGSMLGENANFWMLGVVVLVLTVGAVASMLAASRSRDDASH